MSPTAEITDSAIILRTAYSDLQTCQSLPGRRWDKARRVWTLPATPACAVAVRAAFPALAGNEALAALAGRHGKAESARAADCPAVASKTTAWKHQRRGTHLILHQAATYLAFDMGTGKTKCVVDAVCALPAPAAPRVLIVAPPSVVSVWPPEFLKHGARPVEVHALTHGSVAKRTAFARAALAGAAARKTPCVLVINYEAVWREPFASFVRDTTWDMIVADESQRLKAPGGKQSRFMASVRDSSARRVALSGTPMPHSPLDVYGQFRWLDPGIYGTSFTNFRARYARMGGYGMHQVIGYEHLDELHEKFYSIADRVMKADVLDLPPFTHVQRIIELAPDTRRAYHELEESFIADVEGGQVTAANALARLLRLQQMTSGYARTDDGRDVRLGAEKESELTELLAEDLPHEQPVVVFVRFIHDIEAVAQAAAACGRRCFKLYGAEKQLPDWQTATGGDVLAVQIQTGGLGIDLSRAAYCVFFSLSFSLGDFDQALARSHRQGQTRSVTYIHLIADESVDAKIYAALERRAKVIESVLASYERR